MLAALGLVAACGDSSKPPPVPTLRPNETPAPTTAGLPSQFETDFPLPPNAQFVAGFLPAPNDVRIVLGVVKDPASASWTVKSGFDDVVSFYADALTKSPYDVISSVQTPKNAVIGFHRQGSPERLGIVSVVNNGSSVQLVASVGEPTDPPTPIPTLSTTTPGPLPNAVALSPAFPRDDMPLMDGAYIIASSEAANQGSSTFRVLYLTKNPPSAVADFYSSALRAKGWTLLQRSSSAMQAAINYKKGKGDIVKVSANLYYPSPDYFSVDIDYARQ
jgi:hypothetical protein